jgi:hypothetical protein
MKEQYDNLMAYFDEVRPDLAADPIERERVSQALRRNLKAFDQECASNEDRLWPGGPQWTARL